MSKRNENTYGGLYEAAVKSGASEDKARVLATRIMLNETRKLAYGAKTQDEKVLRRLGRKTAYRLSDYARALRCSTAEALAALRRLARTGRVAVVMVGNTVYGQILA